MLIPGRVTQLCSSTAEQCVNFYTTWTQHKDLALSHRKKDGLSWLWTHCLLISSATSTYSQRRDLPKKCISSYFYTLSCRKLSNNFIINLYIWSQIPAPSCKLDAFKCLHQRGITLYLISPAMNTASTWDSYPYHHWIGPTVKVQTPPLSQLQATAMPYLQSFTCRFKFGHIRIVTTKEERSFLFFFPKWRKTLLSSCRAEVLLHNPKM